MKNLFKKLTNIIKKNFIIHPNDKKIFKIYKYNKFYIKIFYIYLYVHFTY